MPSRIYLDNHSATRPSPKAVEQMLPFLHHQWGALSACHQMGQELYPAVDAAVKNCKQLLGAKESDSLFFVNGGSEAVFQVLWAHYSQTVQETGKNHLLTTVVEDAPILQAFNQFEKVGCFGKMLPVNEKGQLALETLVSEIRPRTSLLSLQWAHGLTGVIQPVEAIAKLCRDKGIQLHLDASGVIGKRFFRFHDLPCDFLSFDGEKIHAPKGTAAVVTKRAALPTPSQNVAGLVALSTALAEACDRFDHMATEVARLRDKLEQGVEGAQVFFQDVERLPNTAVIAFPGVHAEALLFFLNRKGVYATYGGGNSQKLSHLLQACGVEAALAQSAVSFNLSHETTEEEVDTVLEVMHQAVKKLRQIGEKA